MQFLLQQLHGNQFLSGGLVMGIIAAVFAQCRAWPVKAYRFIWRRCFIEVDVPDREEAFRWLDTWLSEQGYSHKRARRLTVKSTSDARFLVFSPAAGSHWFFYQKRIVHLIRERKDSVKNMAFGLQESFILRVYTRSRARVHSLLMDAVKLSAPSRGETVPVYQFSYGDWTPLASVCRRPLDSVVLPVGTMEQITGAVLKFRENHKWYADRGVPWRIGILLAGIPGSGKSSTVIAIASHFQLSVHLIDLKSVDDNGLLRAISLLPSNAIVLLEDIDCIFEGRVTTAKEDAKCATFTGLLNALDGVAAGEGRIVCLTTNCVEKLDAALLRPGRVDLRIDFGVPAIEQKRRLFDRFFPGDSSDKFVDEPSLDSMAKAQQRLLEMSL